MDPPAAVPGSTARRGQPAASPAVFWAWRLEAACRGLPSSVFFSPDGERGPLAGGGNGRPSRSVPAAGCASGAPTTRWPTMSVTASGGASPRTNGQ